MVTIANVLHSSWHLLLMLVVSFAMSLGIVNTMRWAYDRIQPYWPHILTLVLTLWLSRYFYYNNALIVTLAEELVKIDLHSIYDWISAYYTVLGRIVQ